MRSLDDQMKRDEQILSSQAAAKTLSVETHYQHELTTIQGRLATEKSEILSAVLAKFDELEQFGDEPVTEDAFLSVIERIAKRYRTIHSIRPSRM
jgi:hypothetical protein